MPRFLAEANCMNILLIGSGGREHAMAWKLKSSKKCKNLYVAPGNAGTSGVAENIAIAVDDFEAIGKLITEKKIGLLIVGPEDPLVKGIRDYLEGFPQFENLLIVGPGKAGAALEGSKDFSKQFMLRHNIPTAKYSTFTKDKLEEGIAYIKKMSPPIVLKADGLAAGKGVIISETIEEAVTVLKEMILDEKFGAASQKVVIEEFLSGIELSVFVLTDGLNYKILPEAKDYKRIGEGDTGPNTGGMGAISPVNFANAAFMHKVEEKVIKRTIEGLKKDDIPYSGFIFIGLMNVKGEPMVIEYNVRMGDPETEAVIPRIKNDLVDLFIASASGKLDSQLLEISEEFAATVVMVAGGYPGQYPKGKVITGLKNAKEALVFHAGTTLKDDEILTNGGRVLAITGLGTDMKKAMENAYKAVDNIFWEGKNYRKDIGLDLIEKI